MAAPKDFVTGFNHNVRHKGHGYHVQTEDSGTEIAHVSTHLFLGGNILASKKTSYAELRGAPDLKVQVRLLMEEQHRQMLRQLVNGAFEGSEEANIAVEPEQLSGESPQTAGAVPEPQAGKRRPAPLEVVRFPAPSDPGEEEDPFDTEIDIETATGFLPSVETSAGPPRRAAEASFPVQPPSAVQAPTVAFDPGLGGAAQNAPLWPTAVEASRFLQPSPPAPADPAQVTQALGQEQQPARVERTPGPSTWHPDPKLETVFAQDGGGAEKSLDQVILRYLAGERDD